jgi:putative membrane protein insertion efficiency factor
VIRALLLSLIRGYQLGLSPLVGASCRFHPSCSTYAIEALTTHGVLKGTLLAVWRILRCGPWSPGGHDPVLMANRVPTEGHGRTTEGSERRREDLRS